MQRLIINCKTGEAAYIDLTTEEESRRLEEIEVERVRQVSEEKKAARRRLAGVLAELREMRQNRDIFSDDDMAEKQVEIDRLKAVL